MEHWSRKYYVYAKRSKFGVFWSKASKFGCLWRKYTIWHKRFKIGCFGKNTPFRSKNLKIGFKGGKYPILDKKSENGELSRYYPHIDGNIKKWEFRSKNPIIILFSHFHSFLTNLIKYFGKKLNLFQATALRPVANVGDFCTSSCARFSSRLLKYFLAI